MKAGQSETTGKRKARLRCGFSTGTAATAAAQAALRHILTGLEPKVVAVRLPFGIYLPVPIEWSRLEGDSATASVIKDAGDDPDVTNGAEIRAKVRILVNPGNEHGQAKKPTQVIRLFAGRGVGEVTKEGLPVPPGEPAINPVPRQMLADNLGRELMLVSDEDVMKLRAACNENYRPAPSLCVEPAVILPLYPDEGNEALTKISLEVEIEVPKGEELAKHTLNPRLGILGGISILGTTGIVKPVSHEAYEETIRAALSVAAAGRCGRVILSTGGKSEKFSRDVFPGEPPEAFVQIADFFAFAVKEALRFGFKRIVHSVFFGKAIKMAQGHSYTHAHSVPMELAYLAHLSEKSGHDADFCRELASANTARHAFEMLRGRGAHEIFEEVAKAALGKSAEFAGEGVEVRLLLFDYNGYLLADVG